MSNAFLDAGTELRTSVAAPRRPLSLSIADGQGGPHSPTCRHGTAGRQAGRQAGEAEGGGRVAHASCRTWAGYVPNVAWCSRIQSVNHFDMAIPHKADDPSFPPWRASQRDLCLSQDDFLPNHTTPESPSIKQASTG
jgi:hypothetical protein